MILVTRKDVPYSVCVRFTSHVQIQFNGPFQLNISSSSLSMKQIITILQKEINSNAR